MKKILFLVVASAQFMGVALAQDQCGTVAECAQKAMESAYQAKQALQIAMPRGAVLAFNLAKCPDGWSDFEGANGRVIVGFAPSVEQFNLLQKTGGRIDIPQDGTHNHAVRAGRNQFDGRFGNDNTDDDWTTVDNGAHSHGGDNMPPYVVLKFCERQ